MLVTLLAAGVMIAAGGDWFFDPEAVEVAEKPRELTKTPVSVQRIDEEQIKLIEKFSGRLEPFESYTFAFEISGRLQEFGEGKDGQPLDEGMRVKKGQVLAKLDNRLLKAKLLSVAAQLDEAKARLEMASSDYNRGKELKDSGGGLITDEEYETRFTRWKEAKAQLMMVNAMMEQANRNLEDSRIVSPIDGVIDKRYVQVGESVRQHDPIFKIVQLDQVLLVVGVPESKIRKIKVKQEVKLNFIGRDTFGHPWPTRTGHVHQVDETENEVSKLFEVEIRVLNRDGALRPGLIALADIEVQKVRGFKIPTSSVLFRTERDPKSGAREKTASIFSVMNLDPAAKDRVPTVGDKADYVAHRYRLGDWVEQDMHLVLTDLPEEHRNLVVRGQHRLVEDRPVEIVSVNKYSPSPDDQDPPLYGPDAEYYDDVMTGPRAAERQEPER